MGIIQSNRFRNETCDKGIVAGLIAIILILNWILDWKSRILILSEQVPLHEVQRGIGSAIPIDTVKYIVNTLIKDCKVVRPILGISYLESKQARALGIGRCVLVLDVPAGSPAAKAGLKGTRRTETGLVEIGDIIVKVEKAVLNTEANLFQALEDLSPGDMVEIKVLRIEAVNDVLEQEEVKL